MTKFQKQMLAITAFGALTAVTALPAMAAEITPYGSARVQTFWNTLDKSENFNALSSGFNAGSNFGYDESLQANARFGINFKDGDVTGKVEVGAGTGATATADTSPVIRLLYGAWDFGAGKLVVGKDYARYYTFPAQVAKNENLLNGYGNLWDGRQTQVRIDMKNGFYISFMPQLNNVAAGEQETTSTSLLLTVNPTTGAIAPKATGTTEREARLPKVNIGYANKVDNLNYNIGAVAQTYRQRAVYFATATPIPASGVTRGEVDTEINSVLGYLNADVTMGNTKVALVSSYGMNPAEMGFAGRLARGNYGFSDDVVGFSGYLQVTQKLTNNLSMNIGVGYINDKGEANYNTGATIDSTMRVTDDKMAAYINFPITLAKNVSVVPEVYYEDQLGETFGTSFARTDGKNKMYSVGAKWQIDF